MRKARGIEKRELEGARWVRVMGAPIFVRDRGRGPVLLMLHGHPTSSDLWSDLVGDLQRSYRCICPDLPGLGRSGVPRGFDFGLRTMSAFLSELVFALDLPEGLHLVLHDIGGTYGLAWALAERRRMASVVILNSSFSPRPEWHAIARIWQTPAVGELAMRFLPAWLFLAILRSGGTPGMPEWLAHRLWRLYSPKARASALAIYRRLRQEDLRPWREQLPTFVRHVPIKVLWGTADPHLGIRESRGFGTEDIEYFPGRGHWLPAESPTEVAHRIRIFSRSR